MSIIVVYHDCQKAVIASDDRMCKEDPATLVKHRIEGRVNKIVALPRKVVFGTVGRVDLTEKLLAGIAHMCEAHDFRFEQHRKGDSKGLRRLDRDSAMTVEFTEKRAKQIIRKVFSEPPCAAPCMELPMTHSQLRTRLLADHNFFVVSEKKPRPARRPRAKGRKQNANLHGD